MKNKGFTLIELLAVIVVLAIIMIIASMQVNKQIKKSRENANDINKKAIVKAAKTCLVENSEEECDTIEKLQKNGYLDDFSDPWNKENKDLDSSYAIIINEEGTGAKVIYFGDGVTNEKEITKREAEEYFLWCGDKCVKGLSDKGIQWVKNEGDILVFPEYVTKIQDGADESHSFKNTKISALIATNNVTVNADFSNSTINVVRIDGGSIGASKFKNSNIDKLILGKTDDFSLNRAFPSAKINYFKLEKGKIEWDGFGNVRINTIEIGDGVYYMSGNAIYPSDSINKVVFNSPCIFAGRRNPYDGNYDSKVGGWGKGEDKVNCSTSIDEQKNYGFDWYDSPFRLTTDELVIGDNVTIIPSHLFSRTVAKKVTIGKNVKTIEENAFNKNNKEVEEIVIKGDQNRFDEVWDKIPFPSKDKIKISVQ